MEKEEVAIDILGVLQDLAKDAPEEYQERIKTFLLQLDERKKSLEQLL